MKRNIIIIIIALMLGLFSYETYNSQLSHAINYIIFDKLTKIMKKKPPEKHHVVLVEIDEISLKALGQFPWPRVIVATLLDRLSVMQPDGIGFDILFAEADRSSPIHIKKFYANYFGIDTMLSDLPDILLDNDDILRESIQNTFSTLPMVLSTSSINRHACHTKENIDLAEGIEAFYNYQFSLCSIEKLQKASNPSGFINAYLDSDGHYRRTPLIINKGKHSIPSLAIATRNGGRPITVEKVGGLLDSLKVKLLDKTIYTDQLSQVLLNFYDKNWYQTVSALDLFLGKVDSSFIKGKTIIIGASALGLHDHYTILDGEQIPGIYMHATLIENFFNDDLLYEPGRVKIYSFALSLLFTLILLRLIFTNKYNLAATFFFFSVVFYMVLLFYFFYTGIYISGGYFYVPYAFSFLLLITLNVLIAFIEKKNFYKKLSIELDEQVIAKTHALNLSKKKIEDHHNNTLASIRFSSLIQKSIFPKDETFKYYFNDHLIIWKPRDIVSGDIYFCEPVSENEVLVFVIDCTSHGVTGAFVTMLVKAIEQEIKAMIHKNNEIKSPATILHFFNTKLKGLLNQYDKDSISDVGFDGSVIYYDKINSILRFSAGKSNMYVIYSDGLKVYKGDRASIGYVSSKVDFEFKEIELSSKDIKSIYLTTDGYSDQLGGIKGLPMGNKKFTKLLLSVQDKNMAKQKELLFEAFDQYKQDQSQIDDVTVLGLKL